MTSQQSNNSKVFRSMHSQTLVTIMQGVLEMVNFSIMSRILTKQDFGYFALLTAVTVVLASLTEAGIGSSVIQKKSPDQGYVNTSFSLSLTLGFFFGTLLLVCAPLFSELMVGDHTLTTAFRLMSISIYLQGYNNVYNSIMVRKLKFMRLGIYRTISMFVAYIIGIILAFRGFGFYAIIVTGIFNHSLYTIFLHCSSKDVKLKFTIVRNKVKEIFNYGGGLTLTVIIRSITEQVDRLVVARFLSVQSVGVLNRPAGFVNTISNKINGIFDTILFPILSSIQDDSGKIKSAFLKSTTLVLIFSIILSSCVIFSWKYIINIFFGNNWESIKYLLWIFGFLLLFSGVNRIFDCFFRSLALMKEYLLVRTINCILTILAVIVGCSFGVFGVAVAKLICEILSCLIKGIILIKPAGCTYRQLISCSIDNCKGLVIHTVTCFIAIVTLPYAQYYIIFAYIAIILVVGIFNPRLWGPLFVENIYPRYFARLKFGCKSVYKA